MASGKQTPRQKMINMMYLVLTALLALNISKDILNAFAVVEKGYERTVNVLDQKNSEKFEAFETIAKNLDAAKEPLKEAKDVKAQAEILVEEIERLRQDIIKKNGTKMNEELGMELPEKMDDKEGVANLLLKKPQRAKKLKDAINKYRDYLLNTDVVKGNAAKGIKADAALKKDIETLFNTNDIKRKGSTKIDWEHYTFEHYPLIAILTFLRQIESDVVKIESDVVDRLYSSVGKSDFSFDKLKAMIVPESSSIMVGEKFKADIFVTAFDSKQKPIIRYQNAYSGDSTNFSNATVLDSIDEGMGKLEFVARSAGEHTLGAELEIVKSDGTKDQWNTGIKYTVNTPTSVVSPTKMNVFYFGVDNPIAVSVPGVDSKSVKISVSGASSKAKGKGEYTIDVKKGAKTVKVGVNANGRTIGKPHEFRVKKVPNPVATISGKVQGTISKSLMLRTPGIRASLRDFPFDLKFKVTSFVVRINDGDYVSPITVRGDRFTPEIKEKIRKAKPGTDVSFTNIKAKGPARIGVKSCSPVVLTVQ